MRENKVRPLYYFLSLITAAILAASIAGPVRAAQAAVVTYYVSSSGGNDANNGTSEATPFKTINKVNTLNLQAGDKVLFKCGDTWRGSMLTIRKSGSAASVLTFGSYPANCTNQPVISGSQPIAGWALQSGNIYVANLAAGANAGKFGYGVNQLFRDSTPLTLGRWPNIDATDGGYASIDSAPAANQISDSQLPAGNWTGAVAHIRGMRWYIINRLVSARAGQTLTLDVNTDCWGGCTGWGYFINNHLGTLDQDGEWYYDKSSNKIYIYSTSGAPDNTEVEGAVILKNDDRSWGGINLGEDLTGQGIAYVRIENLKVQHWFRHGIATPTNFANYEPHHLTIVNNTIFAVDDTGINLAAWVYDASDGRPDGWRGGYNITVTGNEITLANNMGINLYSRNSTFSNNTIEEIGYPKHLGATGMGCGYDGYGGQCTENGDGIRVKIDQPNDTGNNNLIQGNHLSTIAYNGMDIFGHTNTIKNNAIDDACFAKGDCGGIRTFGRDSLVNSAVYDLKIEGNIITDTIGNTDGCRTDFDALFGFGLYIDNYSRNINVTGNTIANATVHGVLFQNSTGAVTWNTLYNNGTDYPYGGTQLALGDAPAALTNHANNILYSTSANAYTLSLNAPGQFGPSDNNAFFSPYDTKQISASGEKTLAEWKSFSGKDAASYGNWFNLAPATPNNAVLFYNTTNAIQNINLGGTTYKDLKQNIISGTLTLNPYQSCVLVIHSQVDITPPKVDDVALTDPNPNTLAAIHFTVRFTEDVTGVDASDFALTTSGVSGATISDVSGSGSVYTVSASTGTGSGKIRLDIVDDDSILDGASNPLFGAGASGRAAISAAYIIRPLTKKFYSTAPEDGWILESNENSGQGGTIGSNTLLFQLGDDPQNRQYKTILSFDTSALPDTASIFLIKINIKQNGAFVGKNPFTNLGNLLVDLSKGSFGDPGLSASDFQVAPGLKQIGAFGATPAGGWYTALLGYKAWAAINKTGLTEFRLYFAKDDNNDKVADFARFNSGDASSARPELVIQYLP